MEPEDPNQPPTDPSRPPEGEAPQGGPRPEPGDPLDAGASRAGPDTEPTAQMPRPELPPQPQHEPRRLRRSSSDRVIAGVGGGLARHLNVDPIIIRLAIVALVILTGGLGALLYLAAWILVPEDSAPATNEPSRNRTAVVVGIVVAVLAAPILLPILLGLTALSIPFAILALIGLAIWWLVGGQTSGRSGGQIATGILAGLALLFASGVVFLLGGWAAAAGGGVVVAIAVMVAGAALVGGAFVAPVRWLILPALSLALGAGAATAAGIDLDGGVGEKTYRPAGVADMRASYQIGVGDLLVDLRNVDFDGDRYVALDVGIGKATVLVPDDVCVSTRAEVGIGGVEVFDHDSGGIDVDYVQQRSPAASSSRLIVNADVGLGAVEVADNATMGDREWLRGGPDRFDSIDDGGVSIASNRACVGAAA